MAESSFAVAHRHVLAYEGGYSNHPNDPGGVTLNGIIQRVYNAWRRKKGLSGKRLTPAMNGSGSWNRERDAIYRENYWLPIKCPTLEPGVDAALYDYGVNSGTRRAAKVLQRMVGVKVDGRVGPITIAAANRRDPEALVKAICAEREAFFRWLAANKKGMNVFLRGWLRRVADVLKYTTALAKAYKAKGEPPLAEVAETEGEMGKAEIPEPKKTKNAIKGGPVVGAGEELLRDGQAWIAWIAAHPVASGLIAAGVVAAVALAIVAVNKWRQHQQETPMPGFGVVPEAAL